MRIGIAKKLLFGYFIILYLITSTCIFMLVTFRSINKNVEVLVSAENKSRVFSKVKYGSRNLLIVNDFIIGGNKWMYDYYLPETQSLFEQIQIFEKLQLNVNQKTALQQFRQEFNHLNKLTRKTINFDEGIESQEWNNLLEKIDYHAMQIVKLLEFLSSSLQKELVETKASNNASLMQAGILIILFFLVSIIVCIIIVLMVNKKIIHPLKQLKDFTEEIARGNLNKRIDISTNDEIGELTTSFNQMADKIMRNREHLEEQVKIRTCELQEANKELESFSYSVSHDLRSPLRSIDGYSRILLEDYADMLDEEGKRFLKTVVINTEKMGLLIDDLLAFSRIGKKQLEKSEFNIKALTNEIAKELLECEQETNIELKVNDLG